MATRGTRRPSSPTEAPAALDPAALLDMLGHRTSVPAGAPLQSTVHAGPARARAAPRGASPHRLPGRLGVDLEGAEGGRRALPGGRAGVESFALVDEHGRIHGFRRERVPMASLLKAMALVAYLNLPSVRAPAARLRPAAARPDGPAVGQRNGGHCAPDGRRGQALPARGAGRDEAFSFAWPIWGNSRTSAHDQARFFFRIDRLIARRHRSYALRLLADIVAWQRWGIPQARRPAGRSTSRAAGDPAPASSRTSPSW